MELTGQREGEGGGGEEEEGEEELELEEEEEEQNALECFVSQCACFSPTRVCIRVRVCVWPAASHNKCQWREAEPSRAEPSRAEPSRAKPGQAGPRKRDNG